MTKLVILAGGLGTRLGEDTVSRPKPMVEIGGRPILWHIMKYYAHFGVKEFIICAGYKQHVIKEFFANYHLHMNDITFDLTTGGATVHGQAKEDWWVTVVDTGETTMTGGRIKRIRPYLNEGEPFCLTYGDGLCDVDVASLIEFHRQKKVLATLTAVLPPARFGELDIRDGIIHEFSEKKGVTSERHINGGFMVMQPDFLDLIDGDATSLEREPMQRAAEKGKLAGFEHNGFWQCMDKPFDRQLLEEIWASGNAPWKRW